MDLPDSIFNLLRGRSPRGKALSDEGQGPCDFYWALRLGSFPAEVAAEESEYSGILGLISWIINCLP